MTGLSMHGFHGHYLRVDLTTGAAERVALPESVPLRFLGGVGLGTWLLHRESPRGVDPLAPDAAIVFAFSPLVGTALTTSAKFAVVAKSPLTGMLCDALSSSRFALDGKALGVDAIVIRGRAAEPSILVNEEVRATELWGQDPAACERALGSLGSVAAIGVAGERGVRYATISNEGRHAGRGGLGAVLGAKNLKAIVVRGDRPTPIADPEGVRALALDLSRRSIGPDTAKYRELGTAANLLAFDRMAVLPTRNFRESTFEDAVALAPETLAADGRRKMRRSCARCTIGCEHVFTTDAGLETRLEYENLFALGPLCGIGNADTVLEASRRCDEYGIDTVSAGGTIAFAMECRERGFLDEAPEFGDGEGLLDTLAAIALRRGLGDRLAEGSRRLALAIGHDTIDFAPQVKGLEIPGYEPRALQSMALGFAVGTRGADHNKSGAYEADFSTEVDRFHGDDRSALAAVASENRAALFDSLILCKFLRGVFDDVWTEAATMLQAVTGGDFNPDALRQAVARIVDLKKAFNVREGWRPEDDTLPARMLTEPLRAGASRGARLPRERLQAMIGAYNLARGWNADGTLPDDVIARLDLPQPIAPRGTA